MYVMAAAGELRLLVVDDDPLVIAGIRRNLRLCHPGWTVREAGSAMDAMHVLQRHANSIDVVVCDINMPFTPGTRLLKVMHALFPWIVRIALSGMLNGPTLVGCHKHAESHLCKPIPADRLFAEILRLYRLRTQASRS